MSVLYTDTLITLCTYLVILGASCCYQYTSRFKTLDTVVVVVVVVVVSLFGLLFLCLVCCFFVWLVVCLSGCSQILSSSRRFQLVQGVAPQSYDQQRRVARTSVQGLGDAKGKAAW